MNEKEKTDNGIAIALCAAGVLAVVGAVWFVIATGNLIVKLGTGAASPYGTLLSGTTGVFWATAGILIVYATFRSQQNQIEEARRQYLLDSFQRNFFSMLTLHHELVNALSLKESKSKARERYADDDPIEREEWSGRRCFQTIWKALDKPDVRKPVTIEEARAAYEALYDDYTSSLGHYFRNLYHILKFVYEQPFKGRSRYIKILRAQLSTFELLLLFYNGLSFPEVHKLINDTGFFEALDTDRLLIPPESEAKPNHKGFYKIPEAYTDRNDL